MVLIRHEYKKLFLDTNIICYVVNKFMDNIVFITIHITEENGEYIYISIPVYFVIREIH